MPLATNLLQQFRTHWQTWLKVILGLLLLALAVQAGFQPQVLANALQTINPFWALVTLGLVLVNSVSKAWRWSLLLSGMPGRPGVRSTLGPFLTGQAFNMLAWARMGDVIRVWLFSSQTGLPLPGVAATLVIENIFELCAYGTLALVLSASLAAIPSAAGRLPLILIAALAGLGALALFVYQGERVLAALHRRLAQGRLHRLGDWLASTINALTPLKQGHRFWPIVGLTVVVWLSAWFTNQTLFYAFRLNLPPSASLLILVLIILGVAPGLMPTNIGPFYFLTVLALQQYQVNATVALAYAAVLHLLVTGVPVLGAAIHLVDQWRRTGIRPNLTPPLSWPKP
jgi:hypothetical protein